VLSVFVTKGKGTVIRKGGSDWLIVTCAEWEGEGKDGERLVAVTFSMDKQGALRVSVGDDPSSDAPMDMRGVMPLFLYIAALMLVYAFFKVRDLGRRTTFVEIPCLVQSASAHIPKGRSHGWSPCPLAKRTLYVPRHHRYSSVTSGE
jgi:hypothetical protein